MDYNEWLQTQGLRYQPTEDGFQWTYNGKPVMAGINEDTGLYDAYNWVGDSEDGRWQPLARDLQPQRYVEYNDVNTAPASVTQAPVTQAPIAQEPITQEPVAQAPSTQAPAQSAEKQSFDEWIANKGLRRTEEGTGFTYNGKPVYIGYDDETGLYDAYNFVGDSEDPKREYVARGLKMEDPRYVGDRYYAGDDPNAISNHNFLWGQVGFSPSMWRTDENGYKYVPRELAETLGARVFQASGTNRGDIMDMMPSILGSIMTGGALTGAFGGAPLMTGLEAAGTKAAISGLSTAAQGGDLSDVLTSAATSFAVSQGAEFISDAFNASGTPGEGGYSVNQYFADGTVLQNFDNGSTLSIGSDGSVTPMLPNETIDVGPQPGGAETYAIPDIGQIETTPLPQVSVDESSISTSPASYISPEPIYGDNQPSGAETFPITNERAIDVTELPPVYDLPAELPQEQTNVRPEYSPPAELPQEQTNVRPEYNPPSELPPVYDLPSEFAEEQTNVRPEYNPPSEFAEEQTNIRGVPVEERDTSGLPPNVERPFVDSLKDLGKGVWEAATADPLTTAAVIGGGLALSGLSGNTTGNAAADAAGNAAANANKTYTYGEAAPIRRTGLQELYSAASNIYGQGYDRNKLGIEAPPPEQYRSSYGSLLSGQAPGSGRVGLGSLGQGFSYTPIGSSQTFDISAMTPEQIIQMQDMISRRRQLGGI